MQIKTEVSSKKGSKISAYKEDVLLSDLSSVLKTNSHDFPEISLPSSGIYFSGSEDSPEKMEIISTQFALMLNYDILYQNSFEKCQSDFECAQRVPSLIESVNQIANRILERDDMNSIEKNELANDWMSKVLFNNESKESSDIYR